MATEPEAPPGPPLLDGYTLGYRPALDGIRALAIAAVILIHLTYGFEPYYLGKTFKGGFLGVELFFGLSGFLITSLLIEERVRRGSISYRGFYRRRAYRLLPALFFLLLVQVIYTAAYGDHVLHDIKDLLPSVFYFANWWVALGHTLPYGTGQNWSLSVEEQFYFCWPLLLTVILTLRSRNRIVGCFLALTAAAVVTCALVFHLTHNALSLYYQSETPLNVLLLGALFAYLLHTGWRPGRWSKPAGYASLLLLGVLLFTIDPYNPFSPGGLDADSRWLYYGGYTVIAVACVLIINLALLEGTIFSKVMAWRPMVIVGERSYSIYIWHLLIIQALHRALPTQPVFLLVVVSLVLIAICSEFSYRFIERPFLALKDRTRRTDTPGMVGTTPGVPHGK